MIGWYHSHPGYGCWLSGIDVSTQMLNQQFQEPFVSIVVSWLPIVTTDCQRNEILGAIFSGLLILPKTPSPPFFQYKHKQNK